MKIKVPQSVGIYTTCYTYDVDGSKESQTVQGLWFQGNSSSEVDIPSFFHEETYGMGHNVCHVKAKEVVINGLSESSGQEVQLLTGQYRTRAATNGGMEITRSLKVDGHNAWVTIFVYVDRSYTDFTVTFKSLVPTGEWTSVYGYCYLTDLLVRHRQMPGYAKGYRMESSFGRGSTAADRDDLSAQMEATYLVTFGSQARLSKDLSYNELNSMLDTLMSFWYPVVRTTFRTGGNRYRTVVNLPSVSSLSSVLLLDEDTLLLGSGVSGKPYAAYHLKALRQEAYLDALDHVPQLNDNSLGNILELVSFLKGIVIDHRVEIPSSLSSGWLSYRYQYNTTKLDVQEAVSFVYRNVDKTFLESGFSCYGRATRDILGTPVVVKCRIDVKQKELEYLDKIFTSLYRYGLTPSFYVIWDMIPYSFIVDWFIPIGDILSGYDKAHMYDRTYDITNIWYSISYDRIDDMGVPCHAYTRWGDTSPPEFNGYYTLDNKGTTSTKVIGYRILDAMSLLFR